MPWDHILEIFVIVSDTAITIFAMYFAYKTKKGEKKKKDKKGGKNE